MEKFKMNELTPEQSAELVKILNESEDKGKAIYEVIEKINTIKNAELISQLQAENEEFLANESVAKELGLRTRFTADEKAFYDRIVAKQSFTFTQEDVIPTTVIDKTLDDIKRESNILSLVNMAPAGVKKWLAGSHSGAGAWTGLTDALTAELTAAITSIDMEVNKAYVLLVVPKAVRDLGMPLVDKYFKAILQEAMHDVLVKGYIAGTGVKQPVGIMYNLPDADTGAVAAKTVLTTLTGFSPKQLAPVKTTLSHGGKRVVDKLYLIANPTTVYSYVDPALYVMNAIGGYVKASKDDIVVIEEPNMEEGKGIFTLSGRYTMGMNAVQVNEYKELKALDDADLFIGKTYANGQPDDDDTAVVFDATKLKEAAININNTGN